MPITTAGCSSLVLVLIEVNISPVPPSPFLSSLACDNDSCIAVEYCASRAEPSVRDSQYLKHVGHHLHPDIDIMWTGRAVGGCFSYVNQ